MKKIVDYFVATANYSSELESIVQLYLGKGYQPYGDMQIGSVLYQPMVKYEEVSEE
jgi:hypothetical protein